MYGEKYSDFDDFVGKTVTKLEIGDDGGFIRFTFSDGDVATYNAYGDCCSTTWINDLNGVKSLLGQEIITHERGITDDDDDDDDEDIEEEDDWGQVIQRYAERFRTASGYFDILYRNESNGYYGGSLELCGDDDYSWREKPDEQTVWQNITDDWTI